MEKTDPLFGSLQRIGVTGILQGVGKNEGWANQTWLRIEDPLYYSELGGLKDVYPTITLPENEEAISIGEAIEMINEIAKKEKIELNIDIQDWAKANFRNYDFDAFDLNRNIKRGEMALLLDKALDPFTKKQIDIHGYFMN